MNYTIASRVGEVELSAVAAIRQRAQKLETAGSTLTYLLRGEPDFDTPNHIVSAAVQALDAGHTHYSPPAGIRPLREGIAERISRDFGYAPDPDTEILVNTGATDGIYVALQAILNPGDEVILFDPAYDPYLCSIRLAGGVAVAIAAGVETGRFTVPLDAVAEAITRRSRAILFSNPWNPTGRVMSRAELEGLVALAERHNLLLIADEIYESIVYDDYTHVHTAGLSPTARARTVTVNSFSKSYAMTGWRLGYSVAPPSLTQAMLLIAQQFSRSAATFIQHAGVAALQGSQEPVAEMRAAYARRRHLMTDALHEAGITAYRPPEGTFFAMLDVRPLGGDDRAVAEFLIQQAGVVTVPGSVYGAGAAGYIRLSFATDDETLRRGMMQIAEALQEWTH